MIRQRILTPERTRSSSHIFHREIVKQLVAEFAGDGTIRLDKLGFLFVQLCNSSIKTQEHKRHYPSRRTVFSCASLFSIETAVMNKNMDCIFSLLIPSYM